MLLTPFLPIKFTFVPYACSMFPLSFPRFFRACRCLDQFSLIVLCDQSWVRHSNHTSRDPHLKMTGWIPLCSRNVYSDMFVITISQSIIVFVGQWRYVDVIHCSLTLDSAFHRCYQSRRVNLNAIFKIVGRVDVGPLIAYANNKVQRVVNVWQYLAKLRCCTILRRCDAEGETTAGLGWPCGT